MRIAMLTQCYPPMVSGAALFIARLSKDLVDRGHRVLVLAASDLGPAYLTQRGELLEYRLPSRHNPTRVGQRALVWPWQHIAAALDSFQPQILHCHDPFHSALAARLHARRQRIPCLLTILGLPSLATPFLPNWPGLRQAAEDFLWGYAAKLIRYFDLVVTPTETVARLVEARLGVHSRVISLGVELTIFQPQPETPDETSRLRAELGIPNGVPLILHTGRLDPEKRVLLAIRAAAQSMDRSSAHLLVVGDGLQRPVLEQACHALGIAERCHFPGYVTDPRKMAAIYRSADLFVTASPIETQGLVLIEAAACGLPLVAVDAGAVAEIVHPGRNGFLARPEDVDGLAAGIRALLSDPALAARMGRAGTTLTAAHCSKRSAERYENLYMEAIRAPYAQPAPANARHTRFHS